jgi:hypothetical protein
MVKDRLAGIYADYLAQLALQMDLPLGYFIESAGAERGAKWYKELSRTNRHSIIECARTLKWLYKEVPEVNPRTQVLSDDWEILQPFIDPD